MILKQEQIIRDYQIVKQIGQGGMGEVYLAKDLNLEKNVAIKVLRPQLTIDPVFARRFKNEARVQASLIHSNIVALHSFFEDNKLYYMVMEYASGITLDKLIRQINLIPEARALDIFGQICVALNYAHSKNIIHRDIKPSNIMVDPDSDDHVKILDFGIARMVTEAHLTRTGTMLGTINYMSPEQVLAEKDIDHRSDIYSAGIVLFEMLTGRLPHDSDTDSLFKIQEQIVNKALPDPLQYCEFIRPATVELMQALTQKKRENRPDSILTAYLECMEKIEMSRKIQPDTPPPLPKEESELDEEENDDASTTIEEYSDDGNDSPYPDKITSGHKGSIVNFLFFSSLIIIVVVVLLIECSKSSQEAEIVSSAGFELILVKGGTFNYGSLEGNFYDDEADIQNNVTLGSFYIGKYPVTQAEYEEIMGTNPASDYGVGNDYPVYNVSWYDAIKFCNMLSIREGFTPVYSINDSTNPFYWGEPPKQSSIDNLWDNVICNWEASGYRLPTTEEWEYAARGANSKNNFLYSGSNDIDAVAWYLDNSDESTHLVGTKDPNGLGIYDMNGNVAEWCWDWLDKSSYSIDDAEEGAHRILRGGSWISKREDCQVITVLYGIPSESFINAGFRICRTAGQ